jgi:hypothetical protein
MNDINAYWQELSATALVGTTRRATLPIAPAPLAQLLTELGSADAATALLAAAAATTQYRAVGKLPLLLEAAGAPPAPADELPPCSAVAAGHLAAILAGPRALLPEWLAALQYAGRRPPDAALPDLLQLARNDAALSPAIRAVLGPRGRWLAEQNPQWRALGLETAVDLAEDALDTRWQTSSHGERIALLRGLRATQAERALHLIQSTWAQEKAAERAAFIETLAIGLSAADEVLLEAALDDRSKEVRSRAAGLLAQLPGSQLAQRFAARGLAQLRYRGGLLARIEVQLPDACDKAMQRDGVQPTPPTGLGERAWWLSEIVRRTPPSVWSSAWSLTPAKILATSIAKEWRDLLVKAWADAAVAYGDSAWADALADVGRREPDLVPLSALLPLLPAARREALLIKLLDNRTPLGRNHPALSALLAAPRPWSRELALVVIDALRQRFAKLDNEVLHDWHLRAALDEIALALPPALAESAINALPAQLEETPYWSQTAQNFAATLRLRREIYVVMREG